MISIGIRVSTYLTGLILLAFLAASPIFAASPESRVVNRELHSNKFANNKIGVDAVRKMAVYLPPGYDESPQRYPVVYFLPDTFEGYQAEFERRDARRLFDQAIAAKVIGKFILVSVDMTTPVGCSWYVNSPVTGNWEDFMIQDLVPYVDANFKTLPNRESRGIAGDHMGGYGAIRLAMTHSDVFDSVYGLHPVGTGSGIFTMHSRPNWELLARAKSVDDLKADGLQRIFLSIYQAFLPDTDAPPLFFDWPAHKSGNQIVTDSTPTERLRSNFLLEALIPRYADNLKSLRGFKFDWARGDLNQDHVYSNQAFTHKLNEFGIAHEAEEYNGGWGERTWGEEGRVYTEMLPFFQRCLIFDKSSDGSRMTSSDKH